MKVVGLVQARMGSSRLPGKVMMPLGGHPLLWHMVDRLRRAGCCDEIVIATTTDPRNDALEKFADAEGIAVVRETIEDDIAARLAAAVRLTDADSILKTAGDCPLIDPDIMRQMVVRMIEEKADFVSNRVRFTFPLGLSCDVISSRAILWCAQNLVEEQDRELVAIWIRDHPDLFKVVSYENDVDLSGHSWLVDTPDDFEEMSKIFDALHREGGCFGLDDVLSWQKLSAASV